MRNHMNIRNYPQAYNLLHLPLVLSPFCIITCELNQIFKFKHVLNIICIKKKSHIDI